MFMSDSDLLYNCSVSYSLPCALLFF
ncbi:hypothetical protein SDJN02_17957, partial [Cucurbita argyrosperma subsp. argyrosperma]